MKERVSEIPADTAQEIEGEIGEAMLTRLDALSKPDLVTLIKRVSGAMWGIGMMTTDDTRSAMKLKIAGIALTSKDNQTILKACNDWLDREEGKAIQRVKQDNTHTFDVRANGALLSRLAEKMGSREPIVIEGTIDQ